MLKRRDHASGRREPGIASKSVSESLLKVCRESCRKSPSIAAFLPRFGAIRSNPAAFRRDPAAFHRKRPQSRRVSPQSAANARISK